MKTRMNVNANHPGTGDRTCPDYVMRTMLLVYQLLNELLTFPFGLCPTGTMNNINLSKSCALSGYALHFYVPD